MGAVGAGDLRHRVELQARVPGTQDVVSGEVPIDWVTVARPWAQIVPMSGREFLAASAQQSEVRGRIVIRYRGQVDATMRVVHRGRFYNIEAVLPDDDSGIEHLTLMVGEGVTDGA